MNQYEPCCGSPYKETAQIVPRFFVPKVKTLKLKLWFIRYNEEKEDSEEGYIGKVFWQEDLNKILDLLINQRSFTITKAVLEGKEIYALPHLIDLIKKD